MLKYFSFGISHVLKWNKRLHFLEYFHLKHIPSVEYSIIFSYIKAISVNNTPFMEYFICKDNPVMN